MKTPGSPFQAALKPKVPDKAKVAKMKRTRQAGHLPIPQKGPQYPNIPAYMYMYIHMYTYIYIYTYLCINICTYTYRCCLYIYEYMYICTNVYLFLYTFAPEPQVSYDLCIWSPTFR